MEGWLKSWLAGSGSCAHVTNVTADYAAVNVAGPRARATLRKLTDIDLSTEAFRYMACRQGHIAGVPATLLRIGFVGETGWEIHFPAAYGEYLWDTLLEAGAEFGIQPFGVDAQRTLRLEKKHIIIGQDTDSLSSVFDVEMAWCLKFDKADFIGKAGLENLRKRDREQTLAGFVAAWSEPAPEGSAVLDGGRPVGRITSCRRSPYVGGVIGMAWLPPRLAQEGRSIQVFFDGKTESAKVALQPFYDPEGRKLRD
jgi:sarcosine oxidase subunit alpha